MKVKMKVNAQIEAAKMRRTFFVISDLFLPHGHGRGQGQRVPALIVV